ncbi:MAG: twin-arginine translocase subunit TatC [Dethiobacteria bacterium]|jgi:sec-independent protein translocase protein TatC
MAPKKRPQAEMSFFEHLDELRIRLIYIAIAILVATIGCYPFIDEILTFLTRPAGDLELIYTTPAEAFMSQIRLSFISGVVVATPFLVYQVLAFILPGLHRSEKKSLFMMVFSMVLLFALGLSFGYFVVFPYALLFFLGFAREGLTALFSINNYISFTFSFLIAFGFVFQAPLIFWFLGYLGLVSSEFLKKNAKYALLILAIISAIITPPDIFSQIMMLIPLLILYQIGILLVRLTEKKRARGDAKQQ